ncbi:MAG TPA: hypothetical protein VLH09_05850 [Bryobacteraceae bacterium]|nr:hypothetical protein [Bryobacteraceae bacterium]
MSHPTRSFKGCARLAAFAVCLTGVEAQPPSAGDTRVLSLQQRLDQALQANHRRPASAFPVPAQTIPVPGGAALVTIPANAFGPGFPPASAFGIPEQNIKALDRNLVMGSLDFKWLLFDGGMRSGLRAQTSGLVAMMREKVALTGDLHSFWNGGLISGAMRRNAIRHFRTRRWGCWPPPSESGLGRRGE